MVIQRKENTLVVFHFGDMVDFISMCLQGEKYCLFRMLLDSTSKGRKMFLIVESNIVMGYITQP